MQSENPLELERTVTDSGECRNTFSGHGTWATSFRNVGPKVEIIAVPRRNRENVSWVLSAIFFNRLSMRYADPVVVF